MQFKSYSDLYALVKALAGVDSFASAEDAKILANANRRLYQAYAASPMWPRYVVASQARPANDGLIAYEYDDVAGVASVASATRNGSTVTVVCAAAVTFVGGMEVTVSGLTGSVSPNGTYKVAAVTTTTLENDTFSYDITTTNTATETYTGTGVVTPVAVADISDFIRIWNGAPFSRAGAGDMNFTTDVDGAHLVGDHSGLGGYYVAYKKQWDGPYTTASTTIPLEFFYYAAHATYADFLRMDGQVDKAMAEEQVAETYLALEMQKAAHAKNNNRIYSRITTHLSTQGRW